MVMRCRRWADMVSDIKAKLLAQQLFSITDVATSIRAELDVGGHRHILQGGSHSKVPTRETSTGFKMLRHVPLQASAWSGG